MDKTIGSREYWVQEIGNFRKLMGQKSFWRGDPGVAMGALLYCWVHTDGVNEADETLMDATIREYDQRLALVLANPDKV